VAAFVRVSAVLVGMANVFLVSLVGEGELGNALMWNLDPWWPHNALYALCAAVAGLVVSSILLRFARRELRETFFGRYGVMVLAVCLGGVVLGLLLSYAGVLLYSSPLTTVERLLEVTSRLPFTVVAGGVLGAAEGVVLAFPLAAVLGRLRSGGQPS
jgi:hypothetical protein